MLGDRCCSIASDRDKTREEQKTKGRLKTGDNLYRLNYSPLNSVECFVSEQSTAETMDTDFQYFTQMDPALISASRLVQYKAKENKNKTYKL